MQRTYKKSKEVLQGARGKIKFPITDGYMTSAGLETINYQNMTKQIRNTKLEIRTIPALVIYRVRCLYFLIFLGGVLWN